MRPINTVIIHCSDTYKHQNVGASEINQWHMDQGWNGGGYHYVINRQGKLEDGRAVEIIGAHAKGYNIDSIGVCMIGGRGDDGKPDPNFTDAQWATLAKLCYDLAVTYDGVKFVGHCDLPGVTKACPTFNVLEWIKGVDL